MKLGTNKRGDVFTLLTNSNLLAKWNSNTPATNNQYQGYHSQTEQSSVNITPNRVKPPPGKVFGFGIQVSQIPTQIKERTPVAKPIVYGYRSSTKNNSRASPSPYKAQRYTYHADPVTPEPKKPFKLPELQTGTVNKRKVYSQTDINKSAKKRNIFRNDKFSVSQKQSLQNQSDDSFASLTGGQETFRNEIKPKEPEEMPKRSIEAYGLPNEGKSYNIVQKRLNNNRDTLFDFWESRAPKKETPLGVYLQKALNEVSPSHYENRGVGGLPLKSPTYDLEAKGQFSPGKDKTRERGRKSKRESMNLSGSIEKEENASMDHRMKDISILSIDNKYERREIITEPNKDYSVISNKLEELYIQKDLSVPRVGVEKFMGRRASKVLKENENSDMQQKKNKVLKSWRDSSIEKDQGRSERRETTEGNMSNLEMKKVNSIRAGKFIAEKRKSDGVKVNVKNKINDMEFEPHSPQSDDDLSLYDYLKLKKENQDDLEDYDFTKNKKDQI